MRRSRKPVWGQLHRGFESHSLRHSASHEPNARRCLSPHRGELPEWTIGHDWKSCVPARVPWVRIPHSPPEFTCAGCTPSHMLRYVGEQTVMPAPKMPLRQPFHQGRRKSQEQQDAGHVRKCRHEYYVDCGADHRGAQDQSQGVDALPHVCRQASDRGICSGYGRGIIRP